MKIILNCPLPFSLAHGGAQIQIEQTKRALETVGLEVEPLRWWDEKQTGDIFHHFGRVPTEMLHLFHRKGIKVVQSELLTAQGSRTTAQLKLQGFIFRSLEKTMPGSIGKRLGWESYRLADACVAGTPWEAKLMTWLFNAPPERVHVVLNGVEQVFFQSEKVNRGPWLICSATITERKRVLELAQAALAAQTPIWVIGKPYADSDPYAQQFLALARQNPQMIRYEGPIADRSQLARAYREARGFVLLSTMESLSLSAAEAAACECPMLLSDLPWARTTYGDAVSYCPIISPAKTARFLRDFYDNAPKLKPPPNPPTWPEIGRQFKTIYERILSNP